MPSNSRLKSSDVTTFKLVFIVSGRLLNKICRPSRKERLKKATKYIDNMLFDHHNQSSPNHSHKKLHLQSQQNSNVNWFRLRIFLRAKPQQPTEISRKTIYHGIFTYFIRLWLSKWSHIVHTSAIYPARAIWNTQKYPSRNLYYY